MRCLIFLDNAGITGQVELVEDSPEQRAYVKEKGGFEAASFPALEFGGGEILQFPDVDEIVQQLATDFGIDVSSCYSYNAYLEGVYPRYQKMMGKLIGLAGGWPKLFPSIGVRNILVLGASGMVGQRIATEAKQRGHVVTRASRSGDVSVDANDSAAVAAAVKERGISHIVVALGPSRTNPDAPKLIETYKKLVVACMESAAGARPRIFFVGGAGSLKVAEDGPMIMDTPDFPDFVKEEARQHKEAVDYLLALGEDVVWTSLSPAPMIQPGKRTKKFRLGREVVVGREISAEDFAIAALDEIETPKHDRQRFAVAN